MSGLVLLTGATGFVGRQLMRVLFERRISVRAVVRESRIGEMPDSDYLESVIPTQDLFAEKADWWTSACKGVDTVIHVAWYAEPGKYLESTRNIECLNGTLALAAGALQAGVRRFVGVGTCFEYDLSVGTLALNTPLRPATTYAGAKAATYMALSTWLRHAEIEFCWCRLFYLHGEGEDSRRLVPYVRKKLEAGETADLSSGKQVRDYLDVRDAALMIADAAMGTIQGAVNICSGKPVTVREMAEKIADEYGRRDLLRFGVRPDVLADPPYVVGVV